MIGKSIAVPQKAKSNWFACVQCLSLPYVRIMIGLILSGSPEEDWANQVREEDTGMSFIDSWVMSLCHVLR